MGFILFPFSTPFTNLQILWLYSCYFAYGPQRRFFPLDRAVTSHKGSTDRDRRGRGRRGGDRKDERERETEGETNTQLARWRVEEEKPYLSSLLVHYPEWERIHIQGDKVHSKGGLALSFFAACFLYIFCLAPCSKQDKLSRVSLRSSYMFQYVPRLFSSFPVWACCVWLCCFAVVSFCVGVRLAKTLTGFFLVYHIRHGRKRRRMPKKEGEV